MTPRFVCTFPVVPTEEKAIILVKLIVSTLCGLAAPTQPRRDFYCVGHIPLCVFPGVYRNLCHHCQWCSGSIALRIMLQGWSRNRQGFSSWCPCNTHGTNLTDLLSILQWESEGDYGPGVQQEVSVKEGERVLNNLGTVWECWGSVYMAHEPKVEKDWIFLIVICCTGVELGVKISGLSFWKVATTGNRSALFLGGSTSQNFLNMSICFHWDLGK